MAIDLHGLNRAELKAMAVQLGLVTELYRGPKKALLSLLHEHRRSEQRKAPREMTLTQFAAMMRVKRKRRRRVEEGQEP